MLFTVINMKFDNCFYVVQRFGMRAHLLICVENGIFYTFVFVEINSLKNIYEYFR